MKWVKFTIENGSPYFSCFHPNIIPYPWGNRLPSSASFFSYTNIRSEKKKESREPNATNKMAHFLKFIKPIIANTHSWHMIRIVKNTENPNSMYKQFSQRAAPAWYWTDFHQIRASIREGVLRNKHEAEWAFRDS